ncbi:MAG: hypothetical protein SGJ05_02820 [bacterium]|nr:hypothetical protein [bacterium]
MNSAGQALDPWRTPLLGFSVGRLPADALRIRFAAISRPDDLNLQIAFGYQFLQPCILLNDPLQLRDLRRLHRAVFRELFVYCQM